jgi:hypothetical protein
MGGTPNRDPRKSMTRTGGPDDTNGLRRSRAIGSVGNRSDRRLRAGYQSSEHVHDGDATTIPQTAGRLRNLRRGSWKTAFLGSQLQHLEDIGVQKKPKW